MDAPQSKSTAEITEALATFDKPALRSFQKNTPRADISHIPGDTGMPFFGHMYWFLTDVHTWLNKRQKQHGNVFKMHNPVQKSVFILGPEANRLLLQNEDKIFSNFLSWDPVFTNLFDNNILQRDFANHKAHRKILQMAFRRPAIEGHMQLMNPLLKDGISGWDKGRPIKAMHHIKELLLDTGSSVFLGLTPGAESRRLNKAFTDIVAATTDPFRNKKLWFTPYAKGVKGNQLLTSFVSKLIPQRRGQDGRDLLTHLCNLTDDDGASFTDKEILEHIIFILFAAHDTTTSALSAILFALASNLEWQEELREEMFALNKDELEFDDVATLTKTGWTFKEALRMYPALAMMPRYALKDFEYEGHTIPAHTSVWVTPVYSHYMEEYWSNPYTFDPERFSPERAEDKKHFFQYIPFGGGAHKCLGMHFAEVQGKMALFHLLKSYKITKSAKLKRYKYNNIPLTFPTDGLPLTFEKL